MRFDTLEDLVDFMLINRYHVSSGCIGKELLDEGASKTVATTYQQHVLKVRKVGVEFTGRQFARRVDSRRWDPASCLRVFFSPAANRVKTLQSETERIDLPMAYGTSLVRGVLR